MLYKATGHTGSHKLLPSCTAAGNTALNWIHWSTEVATKMHSIWRSTLSCKSSHQLSGNNSKEPWELGTGSNVATNLLQHEWQQQGTSISVACACDLV
jgi:hypothetical protein